MAALGMVTEADIEFEILTKEDFGNRFVCVTAKYKDTKYMTSWSECIYEFTASLIEIHKEKVIALINENVNQVKYEEFIEKIKYTEINKVFSEEEKDKFKLKFMDSENFKDWIDCYIGNFYFERPLN